MAVPDKAAEAAEATMARAAEEAAEDVEPQEEVAAKREVPAWRFSLIRAQ